MATAREWSRAFARQAKADFAAWNKLEKLADLPVCQQLHFLQMACEKLVKAFLCENGSDPREIQSSHAYVARNLAIIVRQQIGRTTGKTPHARSFVLKHCKHLAREIELLSPAVDDGGRRPDNCEYPWEDQNGVLHVPAEVHFSTLSLLTAAAARTILKHLQDAINRLAT